MKTACLCRQINNSNDKGSAGILPALLLASIFFLIAFTLLLLPVNKMLVVSSQKTGKTICTLPIAEGEILDIQFTHSVNLSPITDRYQIRGATLILQSTVFQTYGAGVPILDDGLGKSFAQTEEGFEISGIDLPRREIPIMLQQVPDHRIFYRKEMIHLLDFANAGTIIELTVDNISFMKRFLTQIKTP
ncbi:MAG: DUF1850 domain-containing protein [Clostridia bacterium]|nr:DUF1850 domain-containing protein [Clostridia bacterium]